MTVAKIVWAMAFFVSVTIVILVTFDRTKSVNAAGIFTVSNTNDSGPGSLRQAITDANTAAGGTINFDAGSDGDNRASVGAAHSGQRYHYRRTGSNYAHRPAQFRRSARQRSASSRSTSSGRLRSMADDQEWKWRPGRRRQAYRILVRCSSSLAQFPVTQPNGHGGGINNPAR